MDVDFTDSVTLQRIPLREINPNLSNILVVAIIIGKTRPRKFLDTKAPIQTYRAVWNLTLRDSISDYINCTYWGASETIFQANERFRTGDVVEVINPRIVVRTWNDRSEGFRPLVTSPYLFILNEKSSLNRHDGPWEQYRMLLRSPTKPISGYFPLRDIHARGALLKDTKVDILVVVKGVWQKRTITTRNNENVQVRTIEVFDQTCPNLRIEIWETDIIHRSENWKPRYTALFITDVQILWSNYHRQFIAKISNQTLVTENPNGRETQNLLKYALTAPIEFYEIVDQVITTYPDVNTIQDVMTVKQVQDKVNALLQENNLGTRQFAALLFSFVSSFDLDGLSRTLLIKCGHCKMLIKGSKCENFDCPIVDPEIKFDIKTNITDHTGTLINCRFSGKPVEDALGCTAYEFANMTDDQKCQLKWKYLMRRCAVYIAVLFIGKQKPLITILQLNISNDCEVIKRLPVY